MKNLVFLLAIAVLFSCNTQKEEVESPAERSIGFNTFLPEYKWHLGTEGPIEVVKKIDEAWAKEAYDEMRPYLADTAKFYFADGRFADSPDGFIEFLKNAKTQPQTTK